jgi:hypothetical protein
MKSMQKKIKVLNLQALSYSGTTWLNLLLGSHPQVFALGPPQRMWDLRDKGFEGVCLIHGIHCDFWNGFNSHWDRQENFFTALSEYSGKTIFLMDNAPAEFIDATMQHPDIEILSGRYIRDARAITASFARKMVNAKVDYSESIQQSGWFYHSFHAIPSMAEMNKNRQLVVKYEEATSDQGSFLEKAGSFLDIEYTSESFKFWQWDHHITSGNQGPIAMIKLHQEITVGDFESRDVYVSQLEKLKENPSDAFSDERWKHQLDKVELAEFDRLYGAKNADLGYARSNQQFRPLNAVVQKLKSSVIIKSVKQALRSLLKKNSGL